MNEMVSGRAELSGLDGPSIHADADELLSVAVARFVCCHFVVRLGPQNDTMSGKVCQPWLVPPAAGCGTFSTDQHKQSGSRKK